MKRWLTAVLAALLITGQFSAVAQFGGFELPLGGGLSGSDEAADAEGEGEAGNPGCPDMEDIAKLPPEARRVAGIALQAGNSTFIMMTRGRDILGESVDETGDVTQALRVFRDEAAFMALDCSSDPYYRLGVCFDFAIQCVSHGGGGCDSCGRYWGNLFCKETLKKLKDELPDFEDVYSEADGEARFDGNPEWEELVGLAEEVQGSTLPQELDKFKDDVISGAIDGPVDELCNGWFYGSA